MEHKQRPSQADPESNSAHKIKGQLDSKDQAISVYVRASSPESYERLFSYPHVALFYEQLIHMAYAHPKYLCASGLTHLSTVSTGLITVISFLSKKSVITVGGLIHNQHLVVIDALTVHGHPLRVVLHVDNLWKTCGRKRELSTE